MAGEGPTRTDTDYFLLKNRRERKSAGHTGKLIISKVQFIAFLFLILKSKIRNPQSAIGLSLPIGLFRKNAAVSRLDEFEGVPGCLLFKYILQKRSGILNVQ